MEKETQPSVLSNKTTLILVGLGLVIIAFFSLTGDDIESLPPVVNSPTAAQGDFLFEVAAEDTENWHIYSNDEFGFEVKYPEERMGRDRDGAFYIFTEEHIASETRCREEIEESNISSDDPCLAGIFISIQPAEKWLKNYRVEQSYRLPGSENAIKLNRERDPPQLVVAVPISSMNRFILFEAYPASRDNRSTSDEGALLKKILSTFRFVP